MKGRGGLWIWLVVVGLLIATNSLIACDTGPETDLVLRLVVTIRWDDPPSFRGISATGEEYDVFVTEKTKPVFQGLCDVTISHEHQGCLRQWPAKGSQQVGLACCQFREGPQLAAIGEA